MKGNDSVTLVVMAIVKAVVAVMLVGTACYAVIAGVEISAGMMGLILAVLGAYFGFSSKVSLGDAKYRARLEQIMKEAKQGLPQGDPDAPAYPF